MSARGSRKDAIDRFCKTAKKCALYKFRPTTRNGDKIDDLAS
jgi:hypothetical protein